MIIILAASADSRSAVCSSSHHLPAHKRELRAERESKQRRIRFATAVIGSRSFKPRREGLCAKDSAILRSSSPVATGDRETHRVRQCRTRGPDHDRRECQRRLELLRCRGIVRKSILTAVICIIGASSDDRQQQCAAKGCRFLERASGRGRSPSRSERGNAKPAFRVASCQ